MVQQVEDPALSLERLGWLLGLGFDPWPGNFHRPQVQTSKQTNKKSLGVPSAAQQLMNLARIHEDAGSIPGLA